ncbi:MAG TPA: glucose 1-dehydrogenase [Geminicoccus sp.]|uniref:SDR family NAD(P)-dependent oxidoreductase n=1 Tax=Geminicoccus sp. TaxID=2024832 RepID=UPI002C2B1430|nr:glucose 1-dehydrogenase [Geminicoccus sp.]HWL69572.1 glucose 1-dehydrogenase [Geminicoccus sp.]
MTTVPVPGFPGAFGLAGRTALVTGGGSGIGLAIARCLAAAGARVIIAGRRADVLEEAQAGMEGEVHARKVDLSRPETLQGFVEELSAEFGTIDILVNNAGNTVKKPFEESTLADFDAVFDVHVRGAVELTRHVLKGQVAKGDGVVLFIASMTSFIGQPLVLGYTAAKTAITGIVRGLSAEFAGRGVRINAIAPGWIDTPLYRKATANDPARQAKILGRIQMNRLGTPEDIGWTAVFLASPAAAYVTGQTLVVDGGGVIGF